MKNWNKIKNNKEHKCLWVTSSAYWSFAWRTHIFVLRKILWADAWGSYGVTLFMKNFKVKALSIAFNLPRLWRRYGDDAFVVQKSCHKRNSMSASTQLTGVSKSMLRTQDLMAPCLSWTQLSCHKQMALSQHRL